MLHMYLLAAGEKLIPIDANNIGIPKVLGDGNTLDAIVGIVYTFIAAIALFFIVRGALLFVQSNGDQGMITEARNTVLFSVIGLGLSTIVFAIINFAAGSIG